MGEELTEIMSGSTIFTPSHLTKGMIAGGISLALGVYAAWELAQVSKEEVVALVTGG